MQFSFLEAERCYNATLKAFTEPQDTGIGDIALAVALLSRGITARAMSAITIIADIALAVALLPREITQKLVKVLWQASL